MGQVPAGKNCLLYDRTWTLDEGSSPAPAGDWFDLENSCRRLDVEDLFSNNRKHIEDLWTIIDRQKAHIARLTSQIPEDIMTAASEAEDATASPATPRRSMSVRLIGAVLGHEQQVFARIHEQMLALDIHVCLVPKQDKANITICFHRLISRLSPSELEAYAAHVAGKMTLCCPYIMSGFFSLL
ncbi:hypothetical protein ABBQ38_008225 [Trebouxia sp. C0009 RCD-2024]